MVGGSYLSIITNVGMQMYCCTQQKQAQLFCERFVQLKAKGAEDTFLPARLWFAAEL